MNKENYIYAAWYEKNLMGIFESVFVFVLSNVFNSPFRSVCTKVSKNSIYCVDCS